MNSERKLPVVSESAPGRSYASSALRAARHFFTVPRAANAVALADEFQRDERIEAVAVLDEAGRPCGVITRDRLFSLLGKPYGRDILSRTPVGELAEEAPTADAHIGVFALAAESEPGAASPYRALVDEAGRFRGLVSSRDLAEYLSEMTQEDIDLAGRLQERLEAANDDLGGGALRFEAWSRPAKGVGGDFWFARRLGPSLRFFALCDVSGKGVAASLVVSMVWGMLRGYDFGRGLEALALDLNEALVATFHLEKYLTGFFATLDESSGLLSVADMGHAHARLFRKGRHYRLHGKGRNLPLGVEGKIEVSVSRWRLEPGDAIFVYSDGLVEQEDPRGLEFGEARLAALAAEAGPDGALSAAIAGAVDAHRGRIPQQDDMSFVRVAWEPAGPTP